MNTTVSHICKCFTCPGCNDSKGPLWTWHSGRKEVKGDLPTDSSGNKGHFPPPQGGN